MCDVNAYLLVNNTEEKVLENVDLVEKVENGMKLVNIFGEEKIINAKMVHYNNSEKKMVFLPAA